jgi:hypothetical protein
MLSGGPGNLFGHFTSPIQVPGVKKLLSLFLASIIIIQTLLLFSSPPSSKDINHPQLLSIWHLYIRQGFAQRPLSPLFSASS